MTIPNNDDSLGVQAAAHGRSPDDEARDIVPPALSAQRASLVSSIRARMEALGGVELALPERCPIPEAQVLGK